MSAGSIRRQLAAEAAAAAARVSEARSAAVAHRHNLDPHESEQQRSQGHRGHFRSYMFRNVRTPTPPPTRRTPTPRRRPPAPPGASASGLDHDEQAPPPPTPDGAAAGEALFAPAFEPGPPTRHDEPGERDQEHRREEARGRQRWRIGARSEPPASPADWHAALEARAGSNAKALAPVLAGGITAASAEYRAMALVGTLLALDADPAGAAAATGSAGQSTALALAAVRAYLMHRAEPGPLATLARVKQALLDQRSEPRPPSPAPADPADPAVEARQNRHLLRPLQLLNADRPRTEAQNGQACDRIALVCAASGTLAR